MEVKLDKRSVDDKFEEHKVNYLGGFSTLAFSGDLNERKKNTFSF